MPAPASIASPSPITKDGSSLGQLSDEAIETVEIPLTSDSEFFQILRRALKDLNRLQENGKDLTNLTEASSRKSKAEVEAWRKIFRLYVESQIFFSTNEHDTGCRTSSAAQEKLSDFTSALATKRKGLKLSTHGATAISTFLQINSSLLHFMKFQEINRTALTKIMKKFDKRTTLHTAQERQAAKNNDHRHLHRARPGQGDLFHHSRTTTAQNDYLCPVCFSISYKPVRLRCNHVFCLIVMQRARQDHCPLCRGNVVLEANSDHLDTKLMAFLKAKFPTEVKVKDKENQYAAGVDEDFDKVCRHVVNCLISLRMGPAGKGDEVEASSLVT